jgi:4-amino-4-deoxy-L-arabinose transferase-like glycosyltransferase
MLEKYIKFVFKKFQKLIRTHKDVAIVSALMIMLFSVSVFTILRYGNYFNLNSDDARYVKSAEILLNKDMLTYKVPNKPTVYIMPGVSFILAFFIKICGMNIERGIACFRVFQALLQSGSIFLLYIIAKKCFNNKVALIAAILTLFYIPEIVSSGIILTEVSFKFFFLLLIYLSLKALESKKIIYYALGGVVWGISCLLRATIALYPIIILTMWVIKKYSIKEMFKFAIITVTIFCALLSPWWIRNYIQFHRFIPLTISSGNPFLQGTYIDYDQRSVGATKYVRKFSHDDLIALDKVEMDTGIYRLKIFASKDPLKYISWYTIGKTNYMFKSPWYQRPIFHIDFDTVTFYHQILIFFFLIGIFGFILMKKKSALLPALIIAYMEIIYLPYFTFARYCYPIMPMVIAFSSYGMYGIYVSIKIIKTQQSKLTSQIPTT